MRRAVVVLVEEGVEPDVEVVQRRQGAGEVQAPLAERAPESSISPRAGASYGLACTPRRPAAEALANYSYCSPFCCRVGARCVRWQARPSLPPSQRRSPRSDRRRPTTPSGDDLRRFSRFRFDRPRSRRSLPYPRRTARLRMPGCTCTAVAEDRRAAHRDSGRGIPSASTQRRELHQCAKPGSAETDGSFRAVLGRCDDAASHGWSAGVVPGGEARIVAPGARCLDAVDKLTVTPLKLRGCTDSPSQKFHLSDDGRIRDALTGECVTAIDSTLNSWLALDGYPRNTNQLWSTPPGGTSGLGPVERGEVMGAALRRLLGFSALSTVALLASTAFAMGTDPDPDYYSFHPMSTMYPGSGFSPNDVAHTKIQCFDDIKTQLTDGPGAISTSLSALLVTNSDQLKQTLQLDTEVDASYLVFKGRRELLLSHRRSVFIYVHDRDRSVPARSFARDAVSWKLKPEMSALVADGPAFEAQCGSRFVDMKRRGMSGLGDRDGGGYDARGP